ncbi:MAG: hypothetical protein COA78_33510, partial [Blastopirellula sp.]
MPNQEEHAAGVDQIIDEIDELFEKEGAGYSVGEDNSITDNANRLASKPRSPEGLQPDEGWYRELSEKLKLCNLNLKDLHSIDPTCITGQNSYFAELVHDLEIKIRNGLNPGQAVLRIDEDHNEIIWGDKVCKFYKPSNEFRFFKLLYENIGGPVPFVEIFEVIGKEIKTTAMRAM